MERDGIRSQRILNTKNTKITKNKIIKNHFVCFVHFVFKKLLSGQNARFLAKVPTCRMNLKNEAGEDAISPPYSTY